MRNVIHILCLSTQSEPSNMNSVQLDICICALTKSEQVQRVHDAGISTGKRVHVTIQPNTSLLKRQYLKTDAVI